MNRQDAVRLLEALLTRNAVLCSVPRGQYESHDPLYWLGGDHEVQTLLDAAQEVGL